MESKKQLPQISNGCSSQCVGPDSAILATSALLLLPPSSSSAYMQTSTPILPAELQQLIIDFVGDGYVNARLLRLETQRCEAREALRTCSLVCKAWHSRTLRHTFYDNYFAFFATDRELKRHAELFRILEANPLIRRCIRRAEIYMEEGVLPERVETLCKAITPIGTLRIEVGTIASEDGLPRPSPLDGLHPILTTPYLCDLSIFAARVPLCLLESLTNLRSLTLEGVKTLDAESGRDGEWCLESSTLERLVVTRGRRALSQLGDAVNSVAGLNMFFKQIKILDMDLAGDQILRDFSWHGLLARWVYLENLVFRWNVYSKGKFVPNSTSGSVFDATPLLFNSKCREIG